MDLGKQNRLFNFYRSEELNNLYVGIDCEMSQGLAEIVPIKITLVDE